jgi:ABC-type glycerol-3-phosphate transport system substrate-binding protein
MHRSQVSRRKFIKNAGIAGAAALAAPYVRGAHAAGKVTLALWDHWVPDANNVMTQIINEWGEKNKVEVSIDYITSIGNKNMITATAEAQARTGHDITAHPAWQITVHRRVLEPMDDVIAALVKEHGPMNPVADYLTKFDGHYYGMPTVSGSQVKPCCSRIDLYKQHAGIDIVKMFPADENRDKALVDGWNWDVYLSSAEKLHKAGFPVGLPMGQTTDAVDWVGALFRSYGSVMIDEKDNIKIDSPETRTVLEYAKKLMAFNPPDVYAWDDAGNNRWLISGKGAGIMNPPSAWAVAKRDAPQVAQNCWTHDMPRGPKGRFAPHLPFFFGIWSFSPNKAPAKELVKFLSEKEQAKKLVAASSGYDLPTFKTYYDFDTWKVVEPPKGTVYNYPPRGDEELSMAGYPARPDVAAQIYNQALQTVMIAKIAQGGEKIDDVIKWASGELESYLRT